MKKEYKEFIEDIRQAVIKIRNIDEEQVTFIPGKEGTRFEEDQLAIQKNLGEAHELYTFPLKEAYESYKNGISLNNIIDKLAASLEKIQNAKCLEKVLEATDYEKAENNLFIRLVNIEKNKEDLKDAIYQTIGDIALVLYLQIKDTPEQLISIKIKKGFLKTWKMNKDEVFANALLNTYYLAPPRLYRLEELMYDSKSEGINFMDLMSVCTLNKNPLGNCISTTKHTNGAVAVFLPGVAQRLAYLLDGSFYIVFTSIHEAMIHLDTTVTPDDLKWVLLNTIRENTPPEDILSCKIYYYQKDTNTFSCI